MYYTWSELEINENLHSLATTSMENLFFHMGHFHRMIYAKNSSEVTFFDHTQRHKIVTTINKECINILYAINVTLNNVIKMGTFISEYLCKDFPTSYHTKVTEILWVKLTRHNSRWKRRRTPGGPENLEQQANPLWAGRTGSLCGLGTPQHQPCHTAQRYTRLT